MPDTKFYEQVPQNDAPLRMHLYDAMETPAFPLHWHEHLELHYILEGTMVVRCNQTTVEVTRGQCVIINSNELHEAIGGKCRYFCIMIPPSLMKKNTVLFRSFADYDELSDIIRQMLFEFTHQDEMSDITLTGYALLLLASLYRNDVMKEFDKPAHAAYSQKNVMLNEIIKYIHDHYAEAVSLGLLAERIHISKEHLCRIFKESTNQTVTEYLNRIRIEKAISLLVSTDLSVTEIAFLCGFQDSNYFARKFRELTGKTPSTVRKEPNQ